MLSYIELWFFIIYLVLPYKPNIPLIHSIICYKLFANIETSAKPSFIKRSI